MSDRPGLPAPTAALQIRATSAANPQISNYNTGLIPAPSFLRFRDLHGKSPDFKLQSRP